MDICFWMIESVLYLMFVIGDWFDLLGKAWIDGAVWAFISNRLKYIALLLCAGYGMISVRKADRGIQKRKCLYLCGILLSAACADYFLLFTDAFIAGIGFFALVQCFYCLYFSRKDGMVSEHLQKDNISRLFPMLGTGAGMAAMAWVCMEGGKKLWPEEMAGISAADQMLCIMAIFYGCCLLWNLIGAWKAGKGVFLFGRLGILFLFLCDIHVALYNIEGMHLLPIIPLWLSSWCRAAGVLMWLFYLPSQLCVVKCLQEEKVPINQKKGNKNLL